MDISLKYFHDFTPQCYTLTVLHQSASLKVSGTSWWKLMF